ncbi:Uncharacterised protein g4728 [Pycnogonum litorale]
MKWNDTSMEMLKNHADLRSLPPRDLLHKIWQPKLYYSPALKVQVSSSLDDAISVEIENSTLSVWALYNIHFSCPMNLAYYPLDTQTCDLRMASLTAYIDDLVFKTDKVVMDPHVSSSVTAYEVDMTSEERIQTSIEGREFSSIILCFKFVRIFEGYIYSTFIPSSLFVVISLLSLFIPIQMLQPRITLSITTILTIVTLSGNIRSDLPEMSDSVRAVDLWFLACFCQTFFVLAETVMVTALISASQRQSSNIKRAKLLMDMATIMEKYAIFVLVVLGFLFNLAYWMYFLAKTGRI